MAAAIAFHFIPLNLDTLDIETDNVVLVAIIFFAACYGVGLGNVPWSATELLPTELRAMGTMMITCCNWGPNIIVSSTFLSMMKGITPSGAFGFYAGLSFFGVSACSARTVLELCESDLCLDSGLRYFSVTLRLLV